jgi:hypothetical protein
MVVLRISTATVWWPKPQEGKLSTEINQNNDPLPEDGIDPNIAAIYGDIPACTDQILRVLSNDPMSGSDEVLSENQKQAYKLAFPLVVALQNAPDTAPEGAEEVLDALAAWIVMAGGTRATIQTGDPAAQLMALTALGGVAEDVLGFVWSFNRLTGECQVQMYAIGAEDDL